MSNLIVVGNGFDIAHKMETKYYDFIKNIFDEYFDKKKPIKDIINSISNSSVVCFKTLLSNLKNNPIYLKDGGKMYTSHTLGNNDIVNLFVLLLLHKTDEDKKWCDIEKIYFDELMRYARSNSMQTKMAKKLNDELDIVSNYLKEYLTKQQAEAQKIEGYIELFESISKTGNTLILSFNYTKTIETLYKKETENCQIIHLHGNIDTNIIFGYSPNSEDRTLLINKEENEYLRNIKDDQYTLRNEYYELRLWLDNNEDINVYILGHSCGLTDTYVLSKIFEKASKINIYYYPDINNFSAIRSNVARIINNRDIELDKIINFPNSVKMPQIESNDKKVSD